MTARPNQKVKCVDMSGSANSLYFQNLPVVGETYTIREVASNGNIRLKEITNPSYGHAEGTFSLHRFVDLETGKSLQSGDGLKKILEICLWLVTTPKGFLVFLGIAALFFAIVGSNHSEDSSNNSNGVSESQSPPISSQQTVQTPAVVNSDNSQSDAVTKTGAVIFTRNSNGHDWQRADFQTRQQFCQTIAAAESKEFNHDFTADFYYSALDSFYSSSDPNILNENIHQVIGLTTSAALAGQ